jgi:hypothetical protein
LNLTSRPDAIAAIVTLDPDGVIHAVVAHAQPAYKPSPSPEVGAFQLSLEAQHCATAANCLAHIAHIVADTSFNGTAHSGHLDPSRSAPK